MNSRRLGILASTLLLLPFSPLPAESDRDERGGEPRLGAIGEGKTHAKLRKEAFEDMYRDEFGRVDPDLKLREAWHNLLESRTQPLAIAGSSWTNLGPTNVAGRVSSLALDPTNGSVIYRGTAGGGVWKSTDGGSTWTVLTDNLGDLSIGAAAVAPSNNQIVYVGTGEGALGGDGIDGIGFIRSTDAGANWILPASVQATRYFDLSVHPTNANELVAANTAGFQRSTDGGVTWTTTLSSTYGTSLARDPANASIILGTTWDVPGGTWTGRQYRSTDGGVTWGSALAGPSIGGFNADLGRLEVVFAPSSSQTAYMLAASASGDIVGCPDDPVDQRGIYRSTDNGRTWALRANPYSGSCAAGYTSILAGQGWYAITIKVDPANSAIVYAGGLDTWKSTDSGSTWSKRSAWNASMSASNYVHADIHAMLWSGTTLYIGNDGGVNRTTDGASTFSNLNTGVVTRQYYSIGVTGANRNLIIGGAQDNGTNLRTTSTTSYTEPLGGDGFAVLTHPTTAASLWSTMYYNQIFRSTDTGANWNYTSSTIVNAGERTPFITPLTMDPNNSAIIFTGTQYLWRSTDSGATWAKRSTTDLSNGDTRSGYVTKLAVARANSSHMLSGTASGQVRRSTDGGATWSAALAGLPTKYVAHVEFDPASTAIFYVSYAGGTTGGRLFRTATSGSSFTQIDAGLPNFPVHVIRVDPTDSATLYAGTDVGLYRSTNTGSTWARFGTGLPPVSIWDIGILPDGSMVRVGTHGRGFWELNITATTYSISGSAGTASATVTAGAASTTADASGNFTLSSLAAGTYTVTPSKTGCTFSPTSRSVTVGPNATGISFTATCGGGDTALTSGVALASSVTGASQNAGWKFFTIAVPSGASNLTVSLTGLSADADVYDMQPASAGGTASHPTTTSYTGKSENGSTSSESISHASPISGTWSIGVTNYDVGTISFTITATVTTTTTYTISGSAGTASATVTAGSKAATADASGNYTITALTAGTYTVTPSKAGCTFSPTSRSVTVGPNATGISFTATCSTTLFNDGFEGTGWYTAQVSGTAGAWTIATSGTNPTASVHGGTKMAKFNSYDAAAGSQTRIYRNAGFAVASTYTTVTLKLWMYHDTGYSTYADKVQAQVSTNGTTWVNLGTAINRYTGSTGWAQHTLDLTAYKGQTVYLGFVGISAYGNNEFLDDVTVTGQ